jgi:dienelactone hydrolase
MKIYPFYIVFTVIFLFGVPVNASGAEIVTEEVVYHQNGKNVSGYLARPADKQKHPGLILIHHEIYIYENAGHAFANEGGSWYNQEAADIAWKRTVTFLEKYL